MKTIMILDDEQDFVRLLTLNLNQAGYSVVSAPDGEAGLKLLETKTPALILLDINMPKKSGLDFYKEILMPNERTKFPVLVLTARGEFKEIFENIHADGFMSKPFEMSHLLKEIERIIEKHSGETNAVVPLPPKEYEGNQKKLKRILLVDNDADAFNKIAVTFLSAGYIVSAAKTGMAGIERVMIDRPDVALIKLGLPDLSGDVLGARLHQMRRTSNVPVILYIGQGSSIDMSIAKRIAEKIGLTTPIKTDDPDSLLKEANAILAALVG